jgi:hypothetical protein
MVTLMTLSRSTSLGFKMVMLKSLLYPTRHAKKFVDAKKPSNWDPA